MFRNYLVNVKTRFDYFFTFLCLLRISELYTDVVNTKRVYVGNKFGKIDTRYLGYTYLLLNFIFFSECLFLIKGLFALVLNLLHEKNSLSAKSQTNVVSVTKNVEAFVELVQSLKTDHH